MSSPDGKWFLKNAADYFAAGTITTNEARKMMGVYDMNYGVGCNNNITTTGTQWLPVTQPQPYQYSGGSIITYHPPVPPVPAPAVDEDPIAWLHRRVDEIVDSALVAA